MRGNRVAHLSRARMCFNEARALCAGNSAGGTRADVHGLQASMRPAPCAGNAHGWRESRLRQAGVRRLASPIADASSSMIQMRE